MKKSLSRLRTRNKKYKTTPLQYKNRPWLQWRRKENATIVAADGQDVQQYCIPNTWMMSVLRTVIRYRSTIITDKPWSFDGKPTQWDVGALARSAFQKSVRFLHVSFRIEYLLLLLGRHVCCWWCSMRARASASLEAFFLLRKYHASYCFFLAGMFLVRQAAGQRRK